MQYRLTVSVCTVQTQASDRLSITCYRHKKKLFFVGTVFFYAFQLIFFKPSKANEQGLR